MADLPISGFNPVISSELTDETVIERGGLNFKQTNQNIKDLVLADAIDASHGEMYFQDNDQETVIVTLGVPVKIASTAYNPGDLLGFSHANGTLTYDNPDPIDVTMLCKGTGTLNLASGNISALIFVNGNPVGKSAMSPDLDGVSPSFDLIGSQAKFQLVQGDTIEVFVQNNSGIDNVTVKDLNFIVISSGESSSSSAVSSAYGEAYFITNAAATGFPGIGTAVHINGTYVTGIEKEFSHSGSSGLITYNGTSPISIKVDLIATVVLLGPGTAEYSLLIGLDGSAQSKSNQSISYPVSNSILLGTTSSFFTINPGQVIDAQIVQNSGINTSIRAEQLKLNIITISESSAAAASLPIIMNVSYISPVSTGNPSFTAPIAIGYAAKAEGTWTKVSGMSIDTTSGDISFASDAVTINSDGKYTVSLSVVFETTATTDRISLFTLGIDEDDTDKPLANLAPELTSSESDSSNWINVSYTATRQFTATNIIKIFYSQVNEGGSVVNDVNIAMIRFNVIKIT